MEIVAISAAATVCFLLAVVAWVYVRIEQHKIQYHNPKEIQELRAELERQADIVNRLDAEGLEYIKKKSDEIAGQLRDISVGRAFGR